MSAEHHWGYKPDGIVVVRGDLLRWNATPERAYIITSIGFEGVKLDYWSGQDIFSFRILATNAEYSKDDGKTWFSCNKLMTPSSLDVESTVFTKQLSVHPNQIEPTWPWVLLSWLLCPIFVAATLLVALPGALVCYLEPRARKALQ